MGGTTCCSLFELLEALLARARSTAVGSQVPQIDAKSNEPALLFMWPSCRMEVENARKQQGQRGLLGVSMILSR